jgi:aspartate aminotransferase
VTLQPQRTMQLSHRARVMPASPIRKLAPLYEQARARGVHVYPLNIGQPDIVTPPEMRAAYRGWDQQVLAYGHSGGLAEYRAGLVRYYRRFGIELRAEEILVTTGGSEAILFALMAVCEPGDNVLVPEPFYTNYAGFAIMAGAEVRPLPTRAVDGFHLPPRDAVAACADDRTRAVLYSSPGNPTGTVLARFEIEMLRDLAIDRGWYLLADEVYREFTYDGVRHTSLLDVDGIEDRAIMLDSISKRFSACGARIGALVTRNTEVLETCLRFGQARLCPPTVDQLAALAALDTPPSYFEGVHAEYERRRDVLVAALAAVPGVRCRRPSGAFYLMAELPVDSSERFCRWMLEDFEHEKRTVMMAPGPGFYMTPGAGEREVRLAYVLRCEDLIDAVDILRRGLAAYPGRTATGERAG